MSDKKPGFFKRLLGNLMGSKEKEPAPPPEEPKTEAKAPAAKKPAEKKPAAKKPAAKKTPAKKPAGKRPAAKTAKKPATKAAPTPKVEKKPVAAPKAKPKAKPAPKPKAEPKSRAKPAPKPVKKPAAKKSAPAAEKAPPEKPPEAPTETPAEGAPEPETKKRRSLSDIIPFRSKKEAAAEPEPAPEAEPVPEPEVISEPEASPEPVPEPAPEQAVAREAAEEPAEKKGWFSRLRDGLSKTSNALTENITTIFTKRKLDDETLQELEDALIQADLGVDMAVQITEEVARGRYNKEISPEEVRAVLGAEVAGVLEPTAQPLVLDDSKTPHVVLVVGVNGTGKTTTIGKLGHKFNQEGKKTVLAAGDTFRAAAIDQLKIWGERIGAPVVSGKIGADAAGLAYDALQQAQQSQADVLLIDTAGRLQNKADLMEELAKIVRVVKKLDDSAPHSVLLVLDATTGQNAMRQVEVFQEIAGVTGLVMTKLDGTARGGILVAIAKRFELPVHAIGVGETIEDLQPFDAFEFAAAIAGAQEMVEA